MTDNNVIIGSKVLQLKSVDSTNDYLKKLKSIEPLQNGFTVITAEQINGKGYHNNKWESEPKKNIVLSFLVYPDFLFAQDQFMLSKIVSLAVLDYLSGSSKKQEFTVKWPNDIYFQDLKIAGILIENSVKGEYITDSIIGIGLNINQDSFSNNLTNPISLKKITNLNYVIDNETSKLIATLNIRYKQLLKHSFDDINRDYLNSLYRYNKWAKYKTEKTKFNGKITGVNEFGFLEILSESGELKTFNFKEVEFIF